MGRLIMMGVGLLLVYLAIGRRYEPLLLLPIGFGTILTNIPMAGMNDQASLHLLTALAGGETDLHFGGLIGGMLSLIYAIGIKSGAFPLIIFMGIGALTDFGPMTRAPRCPPTPGSPCRPPTGGRSGPARGFLFRVK